jgi:hypothetical protein
LHQEFSLGDYFPPLEHRIAGRIISAAAYARIKSFVDTIPGSVSALWGFEVPLHPSAGGDNGVADFLFCSTQPERHSKVLAGQSARSKIPVEYLEMPAWQKIQGFCQSWENESHELNGQLHNTWLEFDVATNQPPYQPSFFFGLLPPDATTAAKRRRVIGAALTELTPEIMTPAFSRALNKVMIRRDKSWVFQVGIMLARETTALRLCLRDLADPDEAVQLLIDLGWSGDVDPVRSLLLELAPLCESIDLDIDLETGPAPSIGAKLGIECSFGRSDRTMAYTEQFTQWLVRHDMLSVDCAEALVAYNGLVHQDANPAAWSPHLLKLAALSGPDMANQIACWVHHIKVVYQPDTPLSAKAYLAALTDRMSRQVLRDAIVARAKH